MKIERIKNTKRNIVFQGILKVYQILIPFVMRTAVIYTLGAQYLGLNSLFYSILNVLNLAELGVGGAMVYSMYKPIAEDDHNTICALMRLYRIYYRIIGFVIAVAGLILVPFLPRLIKGDVPADLNLYILYVLNLGTTVLSYWLFAYKNSLLSAHQRGDVSSKINFLISTVQYAAQFIILYLYKSYYGYLISALVAQILINLVTAYVVNRMYPLYKPEGKLEPRVIRGINHRIRDLFTSKIATVIMNSADSVVISAFIGLRVLAIYQNYFYIITAVTQLIRVLFSASMAGIGNSIITETKEKNFNDLKKFTFIIAWIAAFCTCCFLSLFQPFMEIWVGKDLMLPYVAVICFGLYYYVCEISQLLNLYKDAAGIWRKDRLRPLVAAFVNIVLNLIMVQFWGIYGVLLSTVFALLFVEIPWVIHNLFVTVFDHVQVQSYVKELICYTLAAFVTCFITYFCGTLISGNAVIVLVLRGIICIVLPNFILYLMFRKTSEYEEMILLMQKMTGLRLDFLKVKK